MFTLKNFGKNFVPCGGVDKLIAPIHVTANAEISFHNRKNRGNERVVNRQVVSVNRIGVTSITAVSYTHLDVYKRQSKPTCVHT